MTTDTEQTEGAANTEANGTPNAEGQVPDGESTSTPNEGGGEQPEGNKPAEQAGFEFKVPEGVELDESDLGAFKDILKDDKLTKQELAQKVLDLAVSREQARAEGFAKQVSEWAETVKSDPELGKAENLATAKTVIDTFGDDEIRSLLNSTGMGNHPAVVRLCLKIGKAISEDTFVRGKQAPAGAGKSDADIIYG